MNSIFINRNKVKVIISNYFEFSRKINSKINNKSFKFSKEEYVKDKVKENVKDTQSNINSNENIPFDEMTREEKIFNSIETTTTSNEKKIKKEARWKISKDEVKNYPDFKEHEYLSNKHEINKKQFTFDKEEEMEEYLDLNKNELKDQKNEDVIFDKIKSKNKDRTNSSENSNLEKSINTKNNNKIEIANTNPTNKVKTNIPLDKLNSFFKEIDELNDSFKDKNTIFNKEFVGKTSENYLGLNIDKNDYLVKQPLKGFKWGIDENNPVPEIESDKIFNRHTYPTFNQIVKYLECNRFKDIKIYPTMQLGFTHLKEHSVVATGFNSKHIYKVLKDLLRDVKKLEIHGVNHLTISGRRYEEFMSTEIGEVGVYLFTEEGREEIDIDNRWLNRKAMAELSKHITHEDLSEQHKKKRRYKF